MSFLLWKVEEREGAHQVPAAVWPGPCYCQAFAEGVKDFQASCLPSASAGLTSTAPNPECWHPPSTQPPSM